MGERTYPEWLICFALVDGEGGSDTFSAVVQSAPNRRAAIRHAKSVLPGVADDPLLMRMLAWNREASGGLHLPSARLHVLACKLHGGAAMTEGEPQIDLEELEAQDAR